MNMNRFSALALCFLVGLAGSGCASAGKNVESLDLAQCKPDEGLVVVRFLTSRADKGDLEHAEHDPDLDYDVQVSSSKSMLLAGFGFQDSWSVMGKNGPALIVRKLDAGDHYFDKLEISSGTAPLAVRFTVQPGHVTYIGDLDILFIESKGFLGMTNMSCAFNVRSDAPAVMSELRSRYPVVPVMDTLPMVVEEPSL
jgi:hypothetical protein